MHQIPHVFCSFATESKFCRRQVAIEEDKFLKVYLDVDIQMGMLIFDLMCMHRPIKVALNLTITPTRLNSTFCGNHMGDNCPVRVDALCLTTLLYPDYIKNAFVQQNIIIITYKSLQKACTIMVTQITLEIHSVGPL